MTSAPQIGQPAPAFTLQRDGGALVSLADFAGQPIVLFVYPEDGSPSCTKESIGFSALIDDFAAHGAVVLGLSMDPVKKHNTFRDKHHLRHILLSDESRNAIDAYGLWIEKSMYGKTYMGVERATFLIGADHRIAQVWHNVRVKDHAGQVLAALRAL